MTIDMFSEPPKPAVKASKPFRPLLAAKIAEPEKVRFPVLSAPKLDGIRLVAHQHLGLVTRKLLAIPNAYVREMLSSVAHSGLDGEVLVGSPTHPDVYNFTQSGVMSYAGEPEFGYYVFDTIGPEPFETRLSAAERFAVNNGLQFVEHTLCENWADVEEQESKMVELGYEGLMLRDPLGKYKQGRSTEREGILLKLKRWEDDEAEVIGWEPLERNQNEAKLNELGHTKRSTHKANQVADPDLMGTLHLRGITGKWAGVEFYCGSGFDMDLRKKLAKMPDLVGSIANYKWLLAGSKDRPRSPIFRGLRFD